MAGVDGFIDAEETADIVPVVLDRGDAEVSARAAVHFQGRLGADAAHMRLEADPAALRGLAARRPDLAGGVGVHFATRAGMKIHAKSGGGFLEAVVKEVAGNREGVLREKIVAEVIVS